MAKDIPADLDPEFKVEEILDARKVVCEVGKLRVWYLGKFKNFPHSDNRWLPASLCNCKALVMQYCKKKRERELRFTTNKDAMSPFAPTHSSSPPPLSPSNPLHSPPSPSPPSPSPSYSPLPPPTYSSPASPSSASPSPSPASPSQASPSPASPTPASPSPASPASPSHTSPTPASPSPASPTPQSANPIPEKKRKKKKSKKKRVRHKDKVAKYRICHNCLQKGHMASTCPNPRQRLTKIQKTN